jgi:uroporphyrinogen-III synthase
MVNKWRILSTAPLPGRLFDIAVQHFAALDIIPFTKITFVTGIQTQEEIKKLSAQQLTVVFTSANAVKPVAACLSGVQPKWDIYCISTVTREAVEGYFPGATIKGTADNAASLAEVIAKQNEKEVVFFCGDNRLEVLPNHLRNAGVQVKEVVVYTNEETPQEINEVYDAILFFSPSGVRSYFSVNTVYSHTLYFAIGNTTAEAIKQYSNNKIVTATTPSKENVLMLALQHLEAEMA